MTGTCHSDIIGVTNNNAWIFLVLRGANMANDIKIDVVVNDNGSIAEKTKAGEKLQKALKSAADAAANIRIPTATVMAKQGVDAVNASRAPVAANYKAEEKAKVAGGINTATDTNLSRGIGGQTGASARDFAAQAQGLGGLVHVYATFAANIFAVSAAFGALSRAADTTNMVKGLDQLGASSGKALGSLAKQLVSATDGAISFRDAMTASVTASSGGMSNANILRMSNVARQASQALGIAMPDALSRLTRGIVKLEPELLDEIGIMVKLDDASTEYARSIGKTVASLTTFERSQGFANAVLEQGEKKFNAIKIDANPYAKLSASVQNLGQSFLELVNIPLGPIMSLLANNSAVLGLAIAGIAKVLLSQAVPGLLAYKRSLTDLATLAKTRANDARNEANQQLEDQKAFLGEKDAIAGRAATRDYQTAYDSKRKIASLDEKVFGKTVSVISKKSPFDITPSEMDAIKGRAEEMAASTVLIEQTQAKTLTTLYASIAAEKQKATDAGDAVSNASAGKNLALAAKLDAQKAQTAAINKRFHLDNIKASTAEVQATEGIRAAFSNMNKELAASSSFRGKGTINVVTGIDATTGRAITEQINKLGILGRVAETTSGSFNILKNAATSGLSKMAGWLSSFGQIGAIVGIAVGITDLAINALGKNEKEMLAFSKALDIVKDSGDNVSRTLAAIQDKKPLERMSVASTNAIANAFAGVAESITAIVKAGEKATASANWMDKLVDFTKKMYGGDVSTKTKKAIVSSVSDGIDLLSSNKTISTKYQDTLKSIFNIPKLDTKSMTDALDKMDPGEKTAKIKLLVDAITVGNREFNNFNATLQEYTATADIATKASADFNTSLLSSDPMFKMGQAVLSFSLALQKISSNGDAAHTALLDLIQDSKKLALLSPDMALGLISTSQQFIKNSSDIRANADEIARLEKAYDKAKEASSGFWAGVLSFMARRNGLEDSAKSNTAKAAADLREVNARQSALNLKQTDLQVVAMKGISAAQYDAFVRGSKLIEVSLGSVAQKVALGIEKAAANSLSGLQALQATSDFAKKDMQIAMQQLDASYANTVVMEQLRLAVLIAANETAINNEVEGTKKDELKLQTASLRRAYEAINKGAGAVKALVKLAASTALPPTGSDQASIDAARTVQGAGGQAAAAATASRALEAKQREAAGQKAAVDAGIIYSKAVETAKVTQEELNYKAGINKLSSDRIGILQSILPMQSTELTLAKQAYDNAELTQKQLSEQSTIQAKINGLEDQNAKLFKGKAGDEAKARNNKQIDQEKLALTRLKETQEQQNSNKLLQDSIALITIQLALDQKIYDNKVAQNDLDATRKTSELTIARAGLQSDIQLLSYTDAQRASLEKMQSLREANLALSTAQVDMSTSIAKIEEDTAKKMIEIKQPDAEGFNQVQADLELEMNNTLAASTELELTKLDTQRSKYIGIYNEKVKIADITEITSLALAKQNEQIALTVGLTGSLTTAFGAFGEALGKAGEALIKMNQEDEKNSATRAKLAAQTALAEQESGTDSIQYLQAKKAERDMDRKTAISQLDNIAAIAGAGKKMLKEKTLGYTIMSGIEKAASIASAVARAEDLAATAASALAKIGINIPAIYASFMAQMGPWGAAAAAAAIAMFIGSAHSGSTGGSVNMAGITAVDKQATQGTGQDWQSGAKVDIGGGVFGDNTAKNNAIVASLEIMKNNSIEGLSYDNRMLKAMEKLAASVTDVAASVYQVPGIRTGSAFGTSEGTSGGSTLGWGSSISTSVQDTGIAIKGFFSDLTNASTNAIQQYEKTLVQTSSSSWFGLSKSSSSSLQESTSALKDQGLQQAFADIFSNATSLFIDIGKQAGMTEASVKNILSAVDVNLTTSLKGLTGPEMEAALNSTVGAALSKASETLFSGMFAKFKVFGEDYLTTVIRVVDANQKVDLSFKSIGKSFEVLGNFNVTESLVNAAGGLDVFISSISDFGSRFLTDTERLVPKQEALTQEMRKLGYGAIVTREAFTNLVLGFKVTDVASAETYARLLKASTAFDEVTKAAEDFAKAQMDQSITIYGLLGDSEGALLLTRQKELDGLDTRLVAGQKYIYALQDEATIRGKLQAAYTKQNSTLTTTVNNLNGFIKSITAARDALVLGAQSTLTPAEKYAEARSQVETLKAAMATTGMDDASVLARNDALSKLPSVTGTFLDASKVLYASSEQYTKDFTSVLDLLDTTATSLTMQQTDAQKQLDQLVTSTEYLNSIVTNTDTITQLLSDLANAQGITAIAKAASDTATTTNTSNAFSNGPANNRKAVEGFYDTYLHRASDTSGMDWQLKNIDNGNFTVSQIGENIKNSPEGRAQLLYEKLAGRVGEPGGVGYWMNQIAIGKSKEEIVSAFAASVVANNESGANKLARDIASGTAAPVVPGFARGGLAMGLSMVGEKGPELVDFATPSRVYSNKASNDMFNNKELVAEIKRLNATVDKLVANQNTQTGHLIASNFAANAEAAQKVADATLEAASNSSWKERSAIKIA